MFFSPDTRTSAGKSIIIITCVVPYYLLYHPETPMSARGFRRRLMPGQYEKRLDIIYLSPIPVLRKEKKRTSNPILDDYFEYGQTQKQEFDIHLAKSIIVG